MLRLYTADLRAALSGTQAWAPLLAFLAPLPERVQPLERMFALEQRFFLGDHNLLYTDKMSMAVGVEVRVPFLDLDLVELAARIPVRFKQRGRTGKWVLKQAMASDLPAEDRFRGAAPAVAQARAAAVAERRPLAGESQAAWALRSSGGAGAPPRARQRPSRCGVHPARPGLCGTLESRVPRWGLSWTRQCWVSSPFGRDNDRTDHPTRQTE